MSYEIVLFTILITSALIAIKMLQNISSKYYRRRYTKKINYCFLLGLLIGLITLWNEGLALLIASLMSILFLILSVHFYLLRGYVTSFFFLNFFWADTETFKDLFYYIGIIAGIVGIFVTVFGIGVPFLSVLGINVSFFSFEVSPFVPLSFGAISVLANMLGFTIFIPQHDMLYSLLYQYLRKRDKKMKEVKIYDKDISSVVRKTVHTKADMIDAIEALVKKDMCEQKFPVFSVKAVYILNEPGVELLKSHWNRTNVEMTHDIEIMETSLKEIKEKIHTVELDKGIVKSEIKELKKFRKRLRELKKDYGWLLEKKWRTKMFENIKEMEKFLNSFRPKK